MINRIKCLVIDNLKDAHNYDEVVSDNVFGNEETGFDIVFVNEDDDFKKIFSEHRDFDCLLTIGDISDRCFDKLCDYSYQIRKKWLHLNDFEPKNVANSIISVFIGNICNKNTNENALFLFLHALLTQKRNICIDYTNHCCFKHIKNGIGIYLMIVMEMKQLKY